MGNSIAAWRRKLIQVRAPLVVTIPDGDCPPVKEKWRRKVIGHPLMIALDGAPTYQVSVASYPTRNPDHPTG